MPYTDAVWKESLRLYAPAANGTIRRLDADLRLPSSGNVIPAGTVIHLPVLPVHRSLAAYPSAAALVRWLLSTARGGGGHPTAAQRAARADRMPLSSGPRGCRGQHMAAVEAKALLSVLYARYRWARVGKGADVGEEKFFTLST